MGTPVDLSNDAEYIHARSAMINGYSNMCDHIDTTSKLGMLFNI